MVNNNTPVEKYQIDGADIFVKRDDLSAPFPGPQFSKMRGVAEVLKKLPANVKTVGVFDSSVSRAIWAVSYANSLLPIKRKVIGFTDKKGREYEIVKTMSQQFGAEERSIPFRGQLAIAYNIAKREFLKEFPTDSFFFPKYLMMDETIEAVANEVKLTFFNHGTVVCPIGSGVICAGLVVGMLNCDPHPPTVIGVFINPVGADNKRKYITGKIFKYAGFTSNFIDLQFATVQQNYYETENMEVPFPCDDHYDRKALRWAIDNYDKLTKPVMFWNIGADYKYLESKLNARNE